MKFSIYLNRRVFVMDENRINSRSTLSFNPETLSLNLRNCYRFETNMKLLLWLQLLQRNWYISRAHFAAPYKSLNTTDFFFKDNPGPEVIKLFSCSTQLNMEFVLFINLKILTSELSMKKILNFWNFYFYDKVKFHAQLSWVWRKFYNLGAWAQHFPQDCMCASAQSDQSQRQELCG